MHMSRFASKSTLLTLAFATLLTWPLYAHAFWSPWIPDGFVLFFFATPVILLSFLIAAVLNRRTALQTSTNTYVLLCILLIPLFFCLYAFIAITVGNGIKNPSIGATHAYVLVLVLMPLAVPLIRYLDQRSGQAVQDVEQAKSSDCDGSTTKLSFRSFLVSATALVALAELLLHFLGVGFFGGDTQSSVDPPSPAPMTASQPAGDPSSAESRLNPTTYLQLFTNPTYSTSNKFIGEGKYRYQFVVRDPHAPDAPYRNGSYKVQLLSTQQLIDGNCCDVGTTDWEGRTAIYQFSSPVEPSAWQVSPAFGTGPYSFQTRLLYQENWPASEQPYLINVAGGSVLCGVSTPLGDTLVFMTEQPTGLSVVRVSNLTDCVELKEQLDAVLTKTIYEDRRDGFTKLLRSGRFAKFNDILRHKLDEQILAYGSRK
jgi:hypothetical protein